MMIHDIIGAKIFFATIMTDLKGTKRQRAGKRRERQGKDEGGGKEFSDRACGESEGVKGV